LQDVCVTGEGPSTSRRWIWFLVAGAAAIGFYYVLPLTKPAAVYTDITALVFPVLATGGVIAGIRLNRPIRRLPWVLLAVGEGFNLLGDLVGAIQRNVFHIDPYPSFADFGYLVAYPVIAVALVLFVRRRTPGSHTPAVIDASVVSLALGLLWWLYLVRPLTVGEGSVLEKAVSVAYPAMDMLLIAIALRLTLGVGARTVSYFLLVGSLVMTLLTDVVYAILTAQNLYANTDTWLEWGWLVAYLLMGAAALHPSMRSLDNRAAVALRGASRRRIALLTGAGLLPLGLLLVQYILGKGRDLNVPAIVLTGAALFLLMLARLGGLATIQRRLAIHDGLTGAHSQEFLGEAFRIECARARIARVQLAVLLVDMDNFALVNEVYGTMAGDLVLAEVAARLHRGGRPGDIVAREGTDRFVVLMPAIETREAAIFADRLREIVSGERIPVGDDITVRVTASLGLAMMPRDGTTPHALMQAADQGLYVAKRAGRNRAYTPQGPLNIAAYGPAADHTAKHALT
jgi:two-component system cell cycle response regulator